MTTSQARERLLAAAVEQAMRGGIADQSLRELAAAIGTSHRMLLYHFGSREGLLTAVARAVEEAQRAAVSAEGITGASARRLWQHFSDPRLWPAERLFFELYAQALFGRPGTEGFLDNATEPWVTAIAPAIAREAGLDDKTARAEARLAVAVTRGLLLDLLATGDSDAVTQAFERYLRHAEATYTLTASQPADPASRRPGLLPGPGANTAIPPRIRPDGWLAFMCWGASEDDPCPGFQPGIPRARTGDGACDAADQSDYMEVNMAIADADVASRADLLHETSLHHGSFEAVAPPHDWWDWYAAYMLAREAGSTSDEAAAAAGRYMAEVKHVVVPSA